MIPLYESGIVIFIWRVTWNYAYNPFNIILTAQRDNDAFKPLSEYIARGREKSLL